MWCWLDFRKLSSQCIHTKFLTLKHSPRICGIWSQPSDTTIFGRWQFIWGDKTKPLGKCQQAIILIPRVGEPMWGFSQITEQVYSTYMSGNREERVQRGPSSPLSPLWDGFMLKLPLYHLVIRRSHFDKQITVALGPIVTNSEPFQCLCKFLKCLKIFFPSVHSKRSKWSVSLGKAWRNIYRTWQQVACSRVFMQLCWTSSREPASLANRGTWTLWSGLSLKTSKKLKLYYVQ